MTYEVIILGHLHMPLYFIGTFTEYSYIWYSVQQLAGWAYPEALGSSVPGLLKSLVFSIIIVQLTGLLVKGKIKLKV